jgi:plasmid maintenance system antidote protein VapI
MGTVLRFPRHARASAAGLCSLANRSKVTPFTLLAFAKSTMAAQRTGGMYPRVRQLLTTGGSTPIPSATAVVPPRSAMMSFTDIPEPYFTKCEAVKPHVLSSDFSADSLASSGVPKALDQIALRLLTLRAWRNLSQKDFCAEIDVGTNNYSPFENAKRRIPLEIAFKLVDQYGITLDWIYRGDMRGMTGQMQAELRLAETRAKAA